MRFISPYLSVYKPQFGSLVSIFGRITGVSLFLIFVIFLLLENAKEHLLIDVYNYYALYFLLLKSETITTISFYIFIVSNLMYHLVFSIRYLFWSFTGGTKKLYKLGLNSMDSSVYILGSSTLLLTLLFCVILI